MERGATVTCIFEFPDVISFENVAAMKLYVTGVGSGRILVKSLEEDELLFMDEGKLRVNFSQEDTLGFADNEDLRMQWHWRNKDGRARTSRVIETSIYEFLGSEPI